MWTQGRRTEGGSEGKQWPEDLQQGLDMSTKDNIKRERNE